MFKELLPIIEDRPMTITVVHVRDGKIKLCVLPHSHEKDGEINKKVGYDKEVPKISDQALKALATPLAIEGTAEELDAELAQQLTSYAEAHVRLQHGIADATQRINAALNEIEEREKSKAKSKNAPGNKKDVDQKIEKDDLKPSAETTLPLDWCAPTSQTAVSANDAVGNTNGGKE
ncbi:MAG: PRTRC system protein E [Candidatus Dormibacteria bacterium]